MKQTAEIILPIEIAEDSAALHQATAQQLAIAPERLSAVRIRKRSLDARQRVIRVRLVVEAIIDEPAMDDPPLKPEYSVVRGSHRVIVVGAGPAGLFAALRLIELNITPIVLERGFDVQLRRRDLAAIQRFGTVHPDSNYCFGEGGAGTYSDGKLYTRSGKRGSLRRGHLHRQRSRNRATVAAAPV